jgi:hypothetical protein
LSTTTVTSAGGLTSTVVEDVVPAVEVVVDPPSVVEVSPKVLVVLGMVVDDVVGPVAGSSANR